MTLSTLFLAGASAFAIVSAGFLMMPSRKTVQRSATSSAAPSEVFTLLSSSRGFQTFNPFRDADPKLEIEHFGPASGVGSGFSFRGREGRGTQTIVDMVIDRSVTMEIDMGYMGQSVQTFTLEPADGGTEITWSVQLQSGFNPLPRIFSLFMENILGPKYERGLANLENVLKRDRRLAGAN